MNAVAQWFDDPLSIRLAWSLIHFLWQGCVLGTVAVVVSLAMQRATAARRYTVFLWLFSAMAIAPVATFMSLESVSPPRQDAIHDSFPPRPPPPVAVSEVTEPLTIANSTEPPR